MTGRLPSLQACLSPTRYFNMRKIINNFSGRLTRNNIGDLNSGLAKYGTTFGNDPFSNITNLTWLEAPTQIDPTGSVITDLIVAMRPRLESGITYVYAIGHTGRLYKIQVNQPSGYNPNLDMPVLLATFSINSPTFKYGGSIQFFGTTTEKLYIGHDLGVTSIYYDGSNETFVGTLASYTANVPRPSVNFTGKLYFGNGNNLLTIDSTETVTTYATLSPAFPSGTVTRDIEVSPDGNYVQIVVSRIPPSDLTSGTQDTSSLSSADSYFVQWNGIDAGFTSYNPYNAYSLNTNISFGPFSYTMGYDLGGAAIYTNGQKIISLPNSLAPNFESMFSTGNLVGFAAPETVNDFLVGSIMAYGQYDYEVPKGLYRFLRVSAGAPQTDIIAIPACTIVSNLFYGASSAGYAGNQVGSAKLYFSTVETSAGPTIAYKFYKFTTVPTGLGTAIQGVYETQQETSFAIFRNIISEKFKVNSVRFYVDPLVANNSFQIDLIGSNGNPMADGSYVFTVGTNVTAGQDVVEYSPQTGGTYSVGIRITNLGSVNWTGNKLEVDYEEWGKK